MKYFNLPGTDLHLSRIAYGTTGFDGHYPLESGLAVVEKYLELGGNFLDTAHCYSFWMPGGLGESEKFVGKAAREFGREKFVIATKGGHVAVPPKYSRPDSFLNPEIVRQDLDESLDRMELPMVDVYFLHRDDPRVPAAEIIESLNVHVAEKRVRYLGASNWSVQRYEEANRHAISKGLQPFVLLQNQWSLAEPDWTDLESPGAMRYVLESEMDELTERQTAVVAYTPTGAGFFASNGDKGGFGSAQAKRRLEAANLLASQRGVSTNQIALAYLLNQPFPVIPILGTRNFGHLEDGVGALDIQLSKDDLATLAVP